MRIVWDLLEDRSYSAGVTNGVLYPDDGPGVAWNGLISVNEAAETSQNENYFDGQKYFSRNLMLDSFSGAISAFTYPDEFEPYIGIDGVFTAQRRRFFGLSYRTDNEIHIIYNALTSPSQKDYSTLRDDITPITLSWNFKTQPIKIPGGKDSSHIVILTDEASPVSLEILEARLYGDDENEPSLPSIEEIVDIFEQSAVLQITDNGDGTWTAVGPDDVIVVSGDQFTINYASVVIIDEFSFRVSSL